MFTFHLQVVFHRTSNVVDLERFPPCLEFWPSLSQWSQMPQLPRWWFIQSRFWQKCACHHEASRPNAKWILFGCYNPTRLCKGRKKSLKYINKTKEYSKLSKQEVVCSNLTRNNRIFPSKAFSFPSIFPREFSHFLQP